MNVMRNRFPGVLWLLPVFFGLTGGIIAALIASMKYQASWIELFIVGLFIQVLIIVGIVLWINYINSQIIYPYW